MKNMAVWETRECLENYMFSGFLQHKLGEEGPIEPTQEVKCQIMLMIVFHVKEFTFSSLIGNG